MKNGSYDIPAIKFGIILISDTQDDYDSKFINFDQVDGLTFEELLSLDSGLDQVTDMKISAYIDLSNQTDICYNYLLTIDIMVNEYLKSSKKDISEYFFEYLQSKICDENISPVISNEAIFSTFSSRYMGLNNQEINERVSKSRIRTLEESRKNGHLSW